MGGIIAGALLKEVVIKTDFMITVCVLNEQII
jgi:hypothetical protein